MPAPVKTWDVHAANSVPELVALLNILQVAGWEIFSVHVVTLFPPIVPMTSTTVYQVVVFKLQ